MHGTGPSGLAGVDPAGVGHGPLGAGAAEGMGLDGMACGMGQDLGAVAG